MSNDLSFLKRKETLMGNGAVWDENTNSNVNATLDPNPKEVQKSEEIEAKNDEKTKENNTDNENLLSIDIKSIIPKIDSQEVEIDHHEINFNEYGNENDVNESKENIEAIKTENTDKLNEKQKEEKIEENKDQQPKSEEKNEISQNNEGKTVNETLNDLNKENSENNQNEAEILQKEPINDTETTEENKEIETQPNKTEEIKKEEIVAEKTPENETETKETSKSPNEENSIKESSEKEKVEENLEITKEEPKNEETNDSSETQVQKSDFQGESGLIVVDEKIKQKEEKGSSPGKLALHSNPLPPLPSLSNDNEEPPAPKVTSAPKNEKQQSFALQNSDYSYNPTDAEIREAFERLIKDNKPPEMLMKDHVMKLINKEKVNALMESDYDAAERCDSYMALLTTSAIDHQADEMGKKYETIYENRAFMLKEEMKTMSNKWDEKIQKTTTEGKDKLYSLQNKHQKEIEEFKIRCQNPEFIRSFNKLSNRLILLRRKEKKLAISRRFEEANDTKILADKIQAKEEANAKLLIEEKIRSELIKILDRQQREITKLKDYIQNSVDEMENLKKRDLQPYEFALKNMDAKKRAKSSQKMLALPNTLITPPIIESKHSTGANTPRTLSKLVQYKNEKTGTLRLAPVSDATIQRACSEARPKSPSRTKKTTQTKEFTRPKSAKIHH